MQQNNRPYFNTGGTRVPRKGDSLRQYIDRVGNTRTAHAARFGLDLHLHGRAFAGLCLFLGLTAFCAGMLAADAGQGPVGAPGPASASWDVLPANFELLDAATLPAGENTLLPGPVLFNPRYFASPKITVWGELSDAGPENMQGRASSTPAPRRRGVLHFAQGRVLFDIPEGMAEIMPLDLSPVSVLQGLPEAPDIFQANLFTTVRNGGDETLIPMLFGEEWDDSGLPLRWSRPVDAPADRELNLCLLDSYYTNLARLLLRGRSLPHFEGTAAASRYRGVAGRYAEKYNLSPALIMAVMHTESNFNPLAVSSSRALGLMQLVPDTAGYEVHRYLTGTPATPGPDILLSPEHNIRYGAVYLHLLGRRYFGGVHNSLSRQLCVIAAYNGGPNAVLRLFDPVDDQNAVQRINELGPEQLYDQLTTRMPNRETRRYVEVVLARMRNYSASALF
ncbi:MAG: transglycosylase SLT domain-containing protein [Desulfovibrio sp.]|jgi:membrane-bound lytic murein transglycosylase C|nr:transglycosylase SLT domain-containing protein [Desulfovibrio sp.]